jgi:hypothetical protein
VVERTLNPSDFAFARGLVAGRLRRAGGVDG